MLFIDVYLISDDLLDSFLVTFGFEETLDMNKTL